MSKLFALEDIDGGAEGEELEASPEVGEVADAETGIVEDAGDISETTDSIDEGLGASEDLEQVEGVVADSEEEGGLTPVAAEAIRIAVESICHRVGANPKTIYSLYATENFKSASSRKANTSIALEGIGSFLKDLWAKIKAALRNLWDKAKAFFDKHLSSLGRIKKALESAKSKLSESSGKVKGEAYLDEAPSSLAAAFVSGNDISASVITKFITAHSKLLPLLEKIGGKGDELVAKVKDSLDKEVKENLSSMYKGSTFNDSAIGLGDKTEPLVGGVYITYTIEKDKEDGSITVDIDRDTVDSPSDKVGLTIADKSGVQSLITGTLKVINDTIKLRDKFSKWNDASNKILSEVSKKLESIAEATIEKLNKKIESAADAASTQSKQEKLEKVKTQHAEARKALRVLYRVQSKIPTINQEVFVLNVKLAKAVLGYAAVCLKHYK